MLARRAPPGGTASPSGFGGTEGYRFVNGVLEKIAARLRPDEVARARNPV